MIYQSICFILQQECSLVKEACASLRETLQKKEAKWHWSQIFAPRYKDQKIYNEIVWHKLIFKFYKFRRTIFHLWTFFQCGVERNSSKLINYTFWQLMQESVTN